MLWMSENVKCSYVVVAVVGFLINITISASESFNNPCQTRISVGHSASVDLVGNCTCDQSSFTSNQTHCGNLEEALLLIAEPGVCPSDCILEILIQDGHYSISQEIVISQSLILRSIASNYNVSVSLMVENSSLHNQSYPLLFSHTEYVEVNGIEFQGGLGIIGFENVTHIVINDSMFSYFYNGAIDIYMSFCINITSCIFQHNGPVAVIKREQQYRGHSGGVSIGYDDDHYNDNGTNPALIPQNRGIYISDCIFRNNTSDPPESSFASDILQAYVFTGRGGSLSILFNATVNVDVKIENTTIEESFAESFGGGLYIVFSGNVHNLVSLDQTKFIRCQCPNGPGGMFMASLFTNNVHKISDALLVNNSKFIDNYSKGGGGLYFYVDRANRNSNPSRIENCTFIGNFATEFGAAISISALQFLQDSSFSESLQIVNCVFERNTCLRGSGVVTTAYLPLAFSGHNKFHRNEGRTLVAAGTRVEVHNELEFTENSGRDTDSGAVYLTSFGQLEIFPGSSLLFKDNIGLLGAAIVVENHAVTFLSQSNSQLLFNPFCPVRSSNAHTRPDDWRDVNITFTGNEALIGSAVYMSDLELCSWVETGPTYFDLHRVFRWNFVHFLGDNINTGHAPDSNNSLWYIQSPATTIRVETHFRNITAYPGELFDLFVVGTDELGLQTSVAVSLTDADGDFLFSPAADVPHNVMSSAITTKYSLGSNKTYPLSKMFTVDSIFTEVPQTTNFTINREECPPGYKLVNESVGSYFCRCNTENNNYIMDCQNRDIYLIEGFWAMSLTSTEEVAEFDALFVHSCPSHYCRCFDLYPSTCTFVYNSERPNDQCHCNRQGVLCGECTNNTGFSALLNKCVSCSPINGLLVAGLIIADALVIGVILALKTPLPTWLYPALFYLQIVPLFGFHFPVNFQGDYALYVSSALSFYFVYDFCLFPDLLAELSYFFRYLPFLVSVALGIAILFLRYRHKLHREPWHGIWWACLLQYTHLLYTSMSVLDCPLLPSSDGSHVSHWYINGNVQCFTGGHLPLAILAILVLTFCVIIIPVIFIYSFQLLKHPSWLRYTIGSLAKGFKPLLSWWPAMELLRRFLLILFIVPFPRNDYPAIFFLAISIAMCGFIQPYKDHLSNIFDISLSSSTVIMLLLRNSNKLATEHGTIDNQTSALHNNNCGNENVVKYNGDRLVWILAPFYYLPLAVLILTISICLMRIVCLKLKIKRPESLELSDPFDDQFNDNHTRRHRSFRTTSVHIGDSQSLFSLSLPRRLTRGHFTRTKNKRTKRQNVTSMVVVNEHNDETVVNPRVSSMPRQSKPSQEDNLVMTSNSRSNKRSVLTETQKKSVRNTAIELNQIQPEMIQIDARQRKRSRSAENYRFGNDAVNESGVADSPDLLEPLLDYCAPESVNTRKANLKLDTQVQAVNVVSVYLNGEEDFIED